MQKCYNVSIVGKVQDIGFRSLLEDTARFLGLKGYAFNDIDGSVKMVCCGENNVIINFLKEIRVRGEQRGLVIDNIAKEEIPFHIFLPEKFSKLYTDELVDIGRKLDIGNERLKEISTKMSDANERLSNVDGKLSNIDVKLSNVDGKLSNIDVKLSNVDAKLSNIGEDTSALPAIKTSLDSFVFEQKEHNKRLEKILEKLV